MLPNEEKIDPRVKRTRLMIEQAFKELVAETSFQNISVQHITEKAGINRATFYAHFPDKFALLDHLIRQEFHQELEKRTLNVCQFSPANLRTLVLVVCEFVDKIHARSPLDDRQFQSLVEARVRAQVHALIDHWLESLPAFQNEQQGRGRAATAVSWSLYGLASEWSRSKHTPPLEEFADQVLPLVAANLGLGLEPA